MSSKEAMPEDVKIVDDENDEARVPAKRSAFLELVFLLNVDILAQDHRLKCGRQRRRDYKLLARAVRQTGSWLSIHGIKCLSPPQTANHWNTLCSFAVTLSGTQPNLSRLSFLEAVNAFCAFHLFLNYVGSIQLVSPIIDRSLTN